MDHKRSAEGASDVEPPVKQQRTTDQLTQPGSDFEPTDLDMIDDGRVAVFQRAQLWAKVADLNTQVASLTARNAQLEEHIASLNHVPRAAAYHLTTVQEDLGLTLKRVGAKALADVDKSPVSAAILDPEVSAADLFAKMDLPIKPIRTLLGQVVWALENKATRPDAEEVEKTMADLHARIRKTSDSLENFSAREEQFGSSLTSTQSDLEDAKQNLETMRKHIVSLELAAAQAAREREAASSTEDGNDATVNGPDGTKQEPPDRGADSKDGVKIKVEPTQKAHPEVHAEVERLRKLAEDRLEEIKSHVEEKKHLRAECEHLREEAEIREGGIVETKEVLGSALYQTMEVTLQQLCLREQGWEREREQKEAAFKEKQDSHEAELRELRDDYEERLKKLKKDVEDMRVEKDKAKAEKDKWSMTYEARKLEHSKGRVIAACEARAELAEKLRDKVQEENKQLKDRLVDLRKRLTAAEDLVSSKLQCNNDDIMKGLQSDLKDERAKSDEFMGEIESMSNLFSDVEAENGRLTKLLAEKEQILSKVMGERLKHRQALTTVKEENRTMLSKLAIETDKLKAVNQVLTTTKKELADAKFLAQKADEESRLLAVKAEKQKRISDELAVTSRTTKAEKDELKRQLDAITGRAKSAVVEMENARFDLRRTEEKLNVATKELTTLESEQMKKAEHMNGDDVRDALIAELRSLLNCSVVTTQRKQVVLLRCGHMFSRQCVDELVAGRNRKCPICGERFGQDDVRPVFFT